MVLFIVNPVIMALRCMRKTLRLSLPYFIRGSPCRRVFISPIFDHGTVHLFLNQVFTLELEESNSEFL